MSEVICVNPKYGKVKMGKDDRPSYTVGKWECDTCRFYPPSSCDGKPCTQCDTTNPLTSCYQKGEHDGNTD